MLKALELHGFKSFADRTRFEFPHGITVVVGPNGSGKSNIVDAIKWVLGEQSAKSLRGKDMADVIFKGSGQSGRKAMNTAEATLVFENADRRLPVDAAEVHITRRVYRSGEGEYLINKQPARLKDIRDMFRGTGVGGDAYSLIEQGKVDRMLQASAKDRRAIFEEAAGISRFKAKKVETQRRLERVEQNMLRLTDIVEEVENRLKAVRAQAGKARRYREYSERLQQLRTQMALVDWRKHTERLQRVEAEQASVQEQIQWAEGDDQRLSALHGELEQTAANLTEALRGCESQLAEVRQKIAHDHSTIEHERVRAGELTEEVRRHGRDLLAMSDKAGDLRQRLAATQSELRLAETDHQTAAGDLSGRQTELDTLLREFQSSREQVDANRGRFVEQLKASAGLARQVETGETQLQERRRGAQQIENQLEELAAHRLSLAEQLAHAQSGEEALAGELAANQIEIEAATDEWTENRNLHAARADDLAQLGSRRHGVAERAAVLEEFERTLEGYGAGVKQLLGKAGVRVQGSGFRVQEEVVRSREGVWARVKGVVADFVHARVEQAMAIDVALGEFAQAVVVEGDLQAVKAVVLAADELAGRAMVIGLEQPEAAQCVELTAEMVAGIQVVARADKLVECAEEYTPLIMQLLGRTFVVRSLADALALRGRAPRGTRLVTLAGELLDAEGAVTFGPRNSATGLVSRRSQLRASRLDLAVLDQQIADAQRETAHLKREVERHEQVLRRLGEKANGLAQRRAAEQLRVQAAIERMLAIGEQQRVAEGALAATKSRIEATETSLVQARRQLADAEADSSALQGSVAAGEVELLRLEVLRQQSLDRATGAKIEVARCRERLESLLLRLTQFERDAGERERGLTQVRTQLQEASQRHDTAELAILLAASSIAGLSLRQQSLKAAGQELLATRQLALADRSRLAGEISSLRKKITKLKDEQHHLELSAEQVRHERKTLADRLREDYSIELAGLTEEATPEAAAERAAVEEEIESLRRKINQIGAVNLDALSELDDLEERFAALSGQHKDLTDAKQSLERIIHKINADSRRLFLDTLEAIRVNFQALYRKAFGGGKADILLEEGVDVLDCGVEIIATPPGKPSFNNSLLSGGEKALTAVALLLAIFQFRPSPFCVLDEVDAPFDEANIGRFVEVLGGFLQFTRFVIVTHSKKTMTSATTLYGVTMQESGVSKRVSVRFDDVSDDGQIRREAFDRSLSDAAAENAA